MKKTKLTKLIISLSLCLVMCVSVFAGCTLVTTDMSRYYSQVVASLEYESGEKIEITKRDLSVAVANYSETYQSYGLEGEEAVRQILESVINEKLVIRASENMAKEQNNGEILTTKEKTYLWELTFETIEDNIISYYNQINGIEEEDSSSTESEDDTVVTQNGYDDLISLQMDGQGGYTLTLNSTASTAVEDHTFWNGEDRDLTTQNDLDVLYRNVVNYVTQNPVYAQGYSRYLSEAKRSEEGMKLSTDNESVFKREIQRVYEVLYNAFMIDKYQEMNQANNASVTINNILELYESRVISDYDKYVTEQASTYEEDVLEDVSSIYYFKPTGTQFFYVSHILAEFSDTDQATYDECQRVLDGTSTKYTVGEAEAIIEDLYSNLSFVVREPTKDENGNIIRNEDGSVTWTETGEPKPVSAVMSEIELKLSTAGDDELLKAQYFDEFIYKYNADPGIINAERNYVIGVDYSTPDTENGTSYTAHSSMVESFTNAAIELYANGSAKIGDLYAQPIRSDYGIHIMIYEGKVENLFSNIDSNFSLSTADIQVLNDARLKAGESKTLLDELYEELDTDRYTIFETMNLQFLRDEVKLTYYPDAYKDLY